MGAGATARVTQQDDRVGAPQRARRLADRRTRLIVNRDRLTATPLRDGRSVFRRRRRRRAGALATPRGHFYIRNRLTRYRSAGPGPGRHR
jgi:hypothetical protein